MIIWMFVIVAALAVAAQDRKTAPSLKSEQSSQKPRLQLPSGWTLAGSRPQDYEAGTDTAEKHSGRASAYLRLGAYKFKSDGFGALAQTIKAEAYRGRRVRLSAYVKTVEVEEYAGLWMRVDGAGRLLGFDNMTDRPIVGTSDWARYEVVLDVPEASVNIAFGLLLRGAGRVWVDDFHLEEVGQDVAVTNLLPPGGKEDRGGAPGGYPARPVNLDFEEAEARPHTASP